MRIVHVVRQFHPAVGGFESVVLELAAAQVADGHQVRIITLDRLRHANKVPKLPASDCIVGAQVVRIPFFGAHRYPIALSVLRHIRDADIVHVHSIDFFFDFLAWTKLLHRKHLIASTHGGFFHTRYAATLKQIYFATVTRFSLSWYDVVVAVSRTDMALFRPLSDRRIVCIENGANILKFSGAAAQKPAKAIAWIGRLGVNKRIDRLMAFFAALHRRDPEWTLKIAGRPYDLDFSEVEALARGENVADAVQINASPSNDEIRQILGFCSVLVSSSDYEGFGLVAVEGLSAGLFPVLSDIPVFRHLIQRIGQGMVLDFSEPDAAAKKFATNWTEVSADYPRLRRTLINAAYSFDWRHVSRLYMELYEKVISG